VEDASVDIGRNVAKPGNTGGRVGKIRGRESSTGPLETDLRKVSNYRIGELDKDLG